MAVEAVRVEAPELPRQSLLEIVEAPEQHLPLVEVEGVLPLRLVAEAVPRLLRRVVAVVARQLDMEVAAVERQDLQSLG